MAYLRSKTSRNNTPKQRFRRTALGLVCIIAILPLLLSIQQQYLSSSFAPPVVNVAESTNLINPDTTNKNDDALYTTCLEQVLLNLPIGLGPRHKRKKIFSKEAAASNYLLIWAHHFDARNPQWNMDIRFHEMPALSAPAGNGNNNDYCSVWEVGAHRKAEDTAILLKTYPHCQYHAYEPIPMYYVDLEKLWKDVPNVHTHNYGLGKEESTFQVSAASLNEQSTYIGDSSTGGSSHLANCGGHTAKDCGSCPWDGEIWMAGSWCNGDCVWMNEECIEKDSTSKTDDKSKNMISVKIQSFNDAVRDAGGKVPTLFHVNCEGCEWDLLPSAVESGFLKKVPIIQIGFHNYGSVGLGQRGIEYCHIRRLLSQTHNLVPNAVPFGWERWLLKEET